MGGNTIVGSMIVLLLVGFVGIVSLTVYDSIDDSLTDSLSSSTGDASAVVKNFSGSFYDGQQLASNVPIILAAGLLLMVIMGFAVYTMR